MMPAEHLSPDRRRLAAALRELREAAGLSADRLGELLSWSSAKVSRLENGMTIPRPREAEAWAFSTGRPDLSPELAALAATAAAKARQ